MSQTAAFTTQSPPADPALRQSLQVASLLPRFGAYLIDALILTVAMWIVSFALIMVAAVVAVGANGGEGFSYSADGSKAGGLLVLSLFYAFAFLPSLAYFTLLPAAKGGFNGRTIGKRAVGLRVVNVDGTRITPATARRRGLAFFGPTFGALVLGTFIDGLAGTPLIFTGILATAAGIYSVTDFTFAPASSELRATLHDRAAKTVVVLASPAYAEATDQPAPITPRPRTGRLNLLNVAGGLYLLALIAGIVLVVAVGASDSTSDASSDDVSALLEGATDSGSEASSSEERSGDASDERPVPATAASGPASYTEAELAALASEDSSAEADDELSLVQGGRVEMSVAAPAREVAADAAKSARGAQSAVTAHARKIADCIGEFNDYLSCAYGSMNDGFDADVLIDGQPSDGKLLKGRSVVVHEDDGDSRVLSVLVYDRNGIGWGYAFNEAETSIYPMCTPVAGIDCTKSEAIDGFTEDDSAFKSVKRAYDEAA